MGGTTSQPSDVAASAPKAAAVMWWRAVRLLERETSQPADGSDLKHLSAARAEVVRLRALLKDCQNHMDSATQESQSPYANLSNSNQSVENVLRRVRAQGGMVHENEFIEARRAFRTEETSLCQTIQLWERGEVTGLDVQERHGERGRGFRSCSAQNRDTIFTRFGSGCAKPQNILFEDDDIIIIANDKVSYKESAA